MRLTPAFRAGLAAVAAVAGAVASPSHPRGLVLLAVALAVGAAVRPAVLHSLLQRLAVLLAAGLTGVLLALALTRLPGAELQSARAVALLWSCLAKSLLVVAGVTVAAGGMSPRELLEALLGLRLPPGLAALCYLQARAVGSVSEETRRLLRARDARGRPRGLYAVRVAAGMSQALVLRLGRRAEIQALALAARGFDGTLPLLDWQPLSPAQLLILLSLGVLALCLPLL